MIILDYLQLDIDRKILEVYSGILLNQDQIDTSVEIITSNQYVQNQFLQDSKKFGIIVFLTSSTFSMNFLEMCKNYCINDLPLFLVIDKDLKENQELKIYCNNIKKFPYLKIFFIDPLMSLVQKLKCVLENNPCEYLTFFTPNDFLHPTIYQETIEEILSSNQTKTLLTYHKNLFEFISDISNCYTIFSLSGVIFSTKKLLSLVNTIQNNQYFFLPEDLLQNYKKNEIKYINYDQTIFTLSLQKKFSDVEIAYLIKDSHRKIDTVLSQPKKLSQLLTHLLDLFAHIVKQYNLNNDQYALMASGCATICAKIYTYIDLDSFRKIVSAFSILFHFDQLLKNDRIHYIHHLLLQTSNLIQPKTIAVIERDHLQDLAKHFVNCLQKEFQIIYISLPLYSDYHFFNAMVVKAIIQPVELVITSDGLHEYIAGGKKVLSLWHGLGVFKKLAQYNYEKYPLDFIVTSSQSCVQEWSEIFNLPCEQVLHLGNTLTDLLFDKHYVQTMRKCIRNRYKIADETSVVVFAPTFREAKLKYYDFGMDIEELATLLEQENIVILAKKHSVFASILEEKHIDTSGIKNSRNGYFIVDEEDPFIDLICAADLFMTDYSSAIFYALLRDLPLILYAPDKNEYLAGPNGLLLDYPDALPAEYVGEADPNLLITAFKQADGYQYSQHYRDFKECHVGACDGKSSNRVIEFIKTLL